MPKKRDEAALLKSLRQVVKDTDDLIHDGEISLAERRAWLQVRQAASAVIRVVEGRATVSA